VIAKHHLDAVEIVEYIHECRLEFVHLHAHNEVQQSSPLPKFGMASSTRSPNHQAKSADLPTSWAFSLHYLMQSRRDLAQLTMSETFLHSDEVTLLKHVTNIHFNKKKHRNCENMRTLNV